MKNKEIQILYIITKLELGGAQKVCLELFNGLNNEGQKALLISGSSGYLVPHVNHLPTVFLLPDFKREWSLKNCFNEIKNFYSLIAHIKNLKKQYPHLIVHTHSTKAGLLGRWAAFFAGVKIRIHTIHGFGFHPFQHTISWFSIYFLELLTSFITTHFICVSSADVKTGIKLFPRFMYKHSIIRAAVDWNQFYTPKKPVSKQEDNVSEHIIFGTVACFKHQKNLIDLFRAFHQAWQKNPSISLQVIGDGHLRDALQQWISLHMMHQSITLLGWQDNVAQYMGKWHAFVLSSLWEGLPCAVVEARLQKLPVLAYNTGGIHDIIRHQENGLLFTPGNWQDLSKGILTLSQDRTLHTSLADAQEDLTEFNTQYMVKKHIQLYRSLLH